MEKIYNGSALSINSMFVESRKMFECIKDNLCGSVQDHCINCKTLMDFILTDYQDESYHDKLK